MMILWVGIRRIANIKGAVALFGQNHFIINEEMNLRRGVTSSSFLHAAINNMVAAMANRDNLLYIGNGLRSLQFVDRSLFCLRCGTAYIPSARRKLRRGVDIRLCRGIRTNHVPRSRSPGFWKRYRSRKGCTITPPRRRLPMMICKGLPLPSSSSSAVSFTPDRFVSILLGRVSAPYYEIGWWKAAGMFWQR